MALPTTSRMPLPYSLSAAHLPLRGVTTKGVSSSSSFGSLSHRVGLNGRHHRYYCGIKMYSKDGGCYSFPCKGLHVRPQPSHHLSATLQQEWKRHFSNAYAADSNLATTGERKTFVSAHYQFDPEVLKNYLSRKNYVFRVASPSSDQIVIKECPFCHDIKNKLDNMWKLNIHALSGSFFCFRCQNKGSWFDFQKRLGDIPPTMKFSDSNYNNNNRGPSGFKPVPNTTAGGSMGIVENNLTNSNTHVNGSAYLSSNKESVREKSHLTLPEQWKLEKAVENLEKFPMVKQYLCGTGKEQRHLKPAVLAAYKVGAGIFRFRDDATQKMVDHECVTFPWLTYYPPGEERAVKKRVERRNSANDPETNDEESTYIEDEEDEEEESEVMNGGGEKVKKELILLRMKYRPVTVKDFRLDPPGGQWGLFGWHLVEEAEDEEEIILTEGEFDAMSVYQATGKPAVSLPNGASSLPIEIIEMLEPFKRIYLWMDDDVKGQEGAEKFAHKLGKGRCFIVKCSSIPAGRSVKDANDALRAKLDLKAMLKNAAPLPHKQILKFSEYRDQIFNELRNPNQVSGTLCRTFPTLNLIIKGHRPGELTIITGHTGVGKTTILSQLSLDFAQQGVNTLWGSFEVENVKLMKKMLTQFAGKNLADHISEFPLYADKFGELPLFFLRFYGTTNIDEVLDAMEYASYVLDVEHVILDNLQFMSGSQAKGYEKFDVLDTAIEKLRKFATDRRVHVTLVIHPKKVDDGLPLTMSSVFGTAKATQEADNVIIVQKCPQWRYLEVCKNRFDGAVGQIPYRFQEDSLRYYELTAMEKLQAQRAAPQLDDPSKQQGRYFPKKTDYKK